jgi:hypothetical protein
MNNYIPLPYIYWEKNIMFSYNLETPLPINYAYQSSMTIWVDNSVGM